MPRTGFAAVVTAVLAVSALGACGHVDAYEAGVDDYEPAYCYQSIGGAVCYREPYNRDAARLVNYYGPHPSRYDAPPQPEPGPLIAPAPAAGWTMDPEPDPAALETAASVNRAVPLPALPELAPVEPAWTFESIILRPAPPAASASAPATAASAPAAPAPAPASVSPSAPASASKPALTPDTEVYGDVYGL